MENKTEKLNQLFNEWEQKVPEYNEHFVKDGIINEELFDKATPKILFITKEPITPKQEKWDYKEWWKDGIDDPFANNIAEWSYGLLNNFPVYDEIWVGNRAHQAIQQIALMNIKKSGGGRSPNYNQMVEHGKLNFDFMHREIAIIAPDLIIVGTTWHKLRQNLFPTVEWKPCGYDLKIGKFNNVKVVDFYQPSNRTPPAASYSLLQNVILSEKFKSL